MSKPKNSKPQPTNRPNNAANPARPLRPEGTSTTNPNKAKAEPTPTLSSVKANRPENSSTTGGGVTGGRKLTPKQEAARRRAQQRRRNQLLIISGVVVVAFVALIVLAITLSQPTNFSSIPTAITTDARPFELGPADAKVMIEEYGDYQCPICKTWHTDIQPQVVNTYINTGKSVRLVFKPFPFLDARAPQLNESHLMVQAAYCASDQSRFWDYHNALYDNQQAENSGFWTTDRLKNLAKVLKLDSDKFNSCLDSNKYKNQANNDATNASNRGITGTPTIIVNGKILSSFEFSEIQKAVDEALNSPTK
jgi:protein-disulfide isomerase